MVISRNINTVRNKTEKRIADRKAAFNKRKSSSSSNNTNQEFITVKDRKVVIVNSAGETLRETLTKQEKAAADKNNLVNNYLTNINQQNKDRSQAIAIERKINTGSANNKDYVDYLNINAKYGNDLGNVKQAIQIGEQNKQIKNYKPKQTDIFIPSQKQNKPAGVISAAPKQSFSASIDTAFKKIEQKADDKSGFERQGLMTAAFVGSGLKSVVVDFPLFWANLGKGLTYDAQRSGVNFGNLSPEERRAGFKSSTENAIPLAIMGGTQLLADSQKEFSNNPASFTGGLVGDLSAGFIWNKAFNVAGNLISRIGKSKIPPGEVFSAETLETGKLPTTKATTESLNRFKEATKQVDKFDDIDVTNAGYTEVNTLNKPVVSHGTMANLGKEGVIAAGPKGAGGFEDPVLFVTAKGEASPLRILDNSAPEYKFSLNPFKMFTESSKVAKVYEFEVLNAAKIPKSVLIKAGFSDDLINFYNSVDDPTVFITKRSALGQGDIPKQSFTLNKDTINPVGSLKVTRNGKLITVKAGETIKASDILKEAGTSEHEGGIIFGSSYKINQANKFTVVNGKTVLVKEGEILGRSNALDIPIKETVRNINPFSSSGSNIYSPSSSSASSNIQYITPGLPSLSGSSFSSSSGSGVLASASGSNIIGSSNSGRSQILYDPSSPSASMSSVSSISSFSASISSRVSLSKPFSYKSGSSSSSPASLISTPSNPSSPSTPSNPSSPSTPSNPSKSYIPDPIIPRIPTSTSNIYGSSNSKRKIKSGFDVFVRRKGQFLKVNARPLIKSQALQKGFFTVGNTAAATFKIKRSFGSLGSFTGRGFSDDFDIKNDRRGGGIVYIERNRRRIKSGGELREITFKGIQANKGKRKSNKNKLLTKSILGF
jgi:hypothetical protein